MSTAFVGDNKAKKVKAVRVWRLPPRDVSIASGDGYGAKSFTAEELESAVRNGLVVEPQPVRHLEYSISRPPQHPLQFFLNYFQIDCL